MSALFNFESVTRLALLFICSSTYLKRKFPNLTASKEGFGLIMHKATIIGDRLSPYVAIICLFMGIKKLIGVFM